MTKTIEDFLDRHKVVGEDGEEGVCVTPELILAACLEIDNRVELAGLMCALVNGVRGFETWEEMN